MELPICAQAGPYVQELEEGKKYYWCTCGLSANQPYCDGAHKGLGMKSLSFEADASKTVAFCGCKQTKTPPYCDDSHMALDK